MNQNEERRIYGWEYPPGAALDPRAPYNQVSKEPEWICEDCDMVSTDQEDFAMCYAGDHYVHEYESEEERDVEDGDPYEESLINGYFREREGA